jgi:hypothetical protein
MKTLANLSLKNNQENGGVQVYFNFTTLKRNVKTWKFRQISHISNFKFVSLDNLFTLRGLWLARSTVKRNISIEDN